MDKLYVCKVINNMSGITPRLRLTVVKGYVFSYEDYFMFARVCVFTHP